MIAYLGLGSNLGDRWSYLRQAARALRELDPDLSVSDVYETSPVGGPPQGEFLNCVVRLSLELAPAEVLALAQRLEDDAGRRRGVRNGPRTLDVDVLLIPGLELSLPELTVPHPRMYERGFVLAPLEELEPDLVPDGWREAFGGAASVAADVRRLGTLEVG